MKHSPHDNGLRSRLGPTKFSAGGFLGTDSRPLDEIVADDLRALEQSGVSKPALVRALRRAYEKARGAQGGPAEIRPGVTAVFHESMGRIPSPFRGDGVFPKGEASVADAATGRRIIITALGIDLIERHDFYQGKGSRYRIDPLLAVWMLSPD
jgi:hypothetical protein